MKIWLKSHLQAIYLVLSRMHNNATSTLLIALAIGVAMSLPGLFYLAIDHFGKFSNYIQDENEISVFLALDANQTVIDHIETVLDSHPQIKQVRFVAKTEAWDLMKSKIQSDKNPISDDLLEKNPLPDAFYIQSIVGDTTSLDSLKNDLSQIPNVDHVLINTDWSKRLSAILDIAKKVIVFIAILLSIGLIVIVGNTIRMQIMTQKDEIEVSYLIGATNSFIRTPFLYAGAAYGLMGGLVAISIVSFSVNRFNHYVLDLSDLYSNDLSLATFNLDLLLSMMLFAVMIGWIGAYFAVGRALASIIASYQRH